MPKNLSPIRCVRGTKDREAEPIESALLTTRPAVGTSYNSRPGPGRPGIVFHGPRRRLQVPHKGPAILPGTVVRVQSARYGIDAVGRVASYSITGTDSEIWAQIEFEEFVE